MADCLPTFVLADGRTVCLGRIRPKATPPALRLSAYLDLVGATPPPASVDYFTKAADSIKRVYLNNQYGDCVIASAYHAQGVWTANESGQAVLGTDQEVYSMYQGICGPGDNGCVITDVLDYRKSHGIPFNGQIHKIDGYVSIDWTNKLEVQVALYLFGAITLGVSLPSSWVNDSIWDVTNSRIVGGHDIPALGYDDRGVTIATWGGLRLVTWAALTSRNWFEEAYAALAPDWYAKANLSPTGLDVATLQADLAKLGGGVIPDIGPPPPPPPPPSGNVWVLDRPLPAGTVIGVIPAASGITITQQERDALDAAVKAIDAEKPH